MYLKLEFYVDFTTIAMKYVWKIIVTNVLTKESDVRTIGTPENIKRCLENDIITMKINVLKVVTPEDKHSGQTW